MTDPVVLPSGATALELIQQIIRDVTPGLTPGRNIFMGYETDTPLGLGLVYLVMDGSEDDPELTMGTTVALENYNVQVVVYGDPSQFQVPRKEAMRLRYVIAHRSLDYTALGLRMLYAQPFGTVKSLGRDAKERHHFMIQFSVKTDPSYT